MPRHANRKRNARTGSFLLGAELRRLRGSRKLSEIAELSKAAPFDRIASSLAEATLCEIENGKTMPSLATLHALSLVYKTSMSHLMSFVVEERLASKREGADVSMREAEQEFGSCLREGEWYSALAIAHEWEMRCTQPAQRLAWRGNRASCLSRIGLHDEAIAMLSGCIEAPGVDASQRFWFLRSLADCQIQAGYLGLASLLLKEVITLAENLTLSEEQRAWVLILRARSLLEARAADISGTDTTTREALRLLEVAEKSVPDGPSLLRIQLLQADGHAQLGNSLLALSRAEQVLARARVSRHAQVEAAANLSLGCIVRTRSDADRAVSCFTDAASVARAGQYHDIEFMACLELFQLQREAHPGLATRNFNRCRELYPLLPERSVAMKKFEAIARSLS